MIGFHFTWDLGFFEIIPYDISFTPEGRVLSHLIAGTFLFLVGVSLSLAHRNGFDARGFLIRFLKIAGAAALVSIGTFLRCRRSGFFRRASLHRFIKYFGFAVSTCAHFLGSISAILVLAAPSIISHSFFDQPSLFWLGLNKALPRTNDYVPFFPWFGIVLSGLLAGRLMLAMPHLAPWPTRF